MGSTRSRARQREWLIGAAAIAIVGTALIFTFTRAPEGGLALNSLPEGVTAHTVQGVPLFLVRHGRDVEGFLDDAQHLANEQLWWCSAEEVFVSPFHGELFDAEGRLLAGPARQDLDRVAVEVTASEIVTVDPFTVQQGTTRKSGDTSGLDSSVWTTYRSWAGLTDGESSTFCDARVVGEGNPHSQQPEVRRETVDELMVNSDGRFARQSVRTTALTSGDSPHSCSAPDLITDLITHGAGGDAGGMERGSGSV